MKKGSLSQNQRRQVEQLNLTYNFGALNLPSFPVPCFLFPVSCSLFPIS
jgi:hypothetical protein